MAGPEPGRRTLTESLAPGLASAVQRVASTDSAAAAGERPSLSTLFGVQRAGRGGAEGSAAHAEAGRGVAGGGGPLPHLEAIQASFGHHDVSGVAAHVGGAAAAASTALGAEAYATGNHVAFKASPNLHTAAHEAAHVVQQRAGVQLKGGFGEVGDRYEQHADAVADLVVQGKSAQPLLDSFVGGGGGGASVQKIEGAESGGAPGAAALHDLIERLRTAAAPTATDTAADAERHVQLNAALVKLQAVIDSGDDLVSAKVHEAIVVDLERQGIALPSAAPAAGPAVQKTATVVQFLGWQDILAAIQRRPGFAGAVAAAGAAVAVGGYFLYRRQVAAPPQQPAQQQQPAQPQQAQQAAPPPQQAQQAAPQQAPPQPAVPLPASAEQIRARTGADIRREPTQFEQRAIDFEAKLAPVAVHHSGTIAAEMCAAARGFMERKAAATAEGAPQIAAKLNALISACGMEEKNFAGGVGKEAAVIKQILMTTQERQQSAIAIDPPSIREQITFIRNFFRGVLAPGLLKDGAAATKQLLGDGGESLDKLTLRLQTARARAADENNRAVKDGDIYDAVPPNPGGGVVTAGAGVDADASREARNPLAITHQANTRIDITDVLDLQHPQRAVDTPDKKARTAADRPRGRTARTVASQADTFPLTSREKAFQEVALDTDVLKWSEGAKLWYANENNAWVAAVRELQLPFMGGPSGMTNSYMNAVQILKGGAQGDMLRARLALIGHLNHIQAHTVVEVLGASAGFGMPFIAGPEMYTSIAPMTVEQLRACGRPGGPDGGKLFPHEPDPVLQSRL